MGAGIDQVAGEPPVPITLWRTATTGEDQPAAIGVRLAEAIVTSYSQPGDTVADWTTDTVLANACATLGRGHRSYADPTDGAALLVADLPPGNPDAAGQLLAAAAPVLRPGGCLILVEAADAGPTDHRPLHAAAAQLGLGYFQHIVAVTARVDGDQFVYYPTAAELAAAAGPGGSGHVRVHRDLRVYLLGGDADA
ncbi:hypothetical protein GCM10010124_36670 [Pilimelia terevasa]|uniref:Uncharacterized protein n=1 Tax=Pilimelia terevasa TaxID=53372 RepID=A0A8J3BUX8_9ACTN|nr:hypothetical protein [Pilimelia terevasa]GGK40550.1 hypothetical protein GCM10010124_36670 [Pilimelia terevasa]